MAGPASVSPFASLTTRPVAAAFVPDAAPGRRRTRGYVAANVGEIRQAPLVRASRPLATRQPDTTGRSDGAPADLAVAEPDASHTHPKPQPSPDPTPAPDNTSSPDPTPSPASTQPSEAVKAAADEPPAEADCPPNSSPNCAFTYDVDIGTWERLAACESSGNWSADTGNGYYGGIQFSLSSWRAVGGSGAPDDHTKWQQIRRGERLRDRQGWGAWPACSRKLGLR